MDVVNDSCLRPSGPLMQQLASLRAALAPADTYPTSFNTQTAAGVASADSRGLLAGPLVYISRISWS